MAIRIASIVEGHSEVMSLPILFRRLTAAWVVAAPIDFPTPIRIKREQFLHRQTEFNRYVELAALKAGVGGRVLILLDADDDCPATLGPEVLAQARAVRCDVPFRVVLAKREFEAWFIAAAESLGLPPGHPKPPDPEAIRGAKEWVGANLLRGSYSETRHQPSLTSNFDLEAAQRAPSFGKFCRDLRQLLSDPE